MKDKQADGVHPADRSFVETAKRLDSEDIAKGLMIFLVVMMHTVGAQDMPVWRVAISSFHVPLFFLVSGVAVGRAKAGWPAYVRNNALALLLPYLVWALIYTPFKIENLPWILYGNWVSLNRIGTNTALWFLPALFCARLLFEAVMRLLERLQVRRLSSVLLTAAAAFALGMCLPQPALGYPLGLLCSVIALGFLLIGAVIGDCMRAVERRPWIRLFVALVATAFFVYGAFLRPGEHALVGVAEFKFGSRFWFFWNAISGCAAILAYSAILSAHLASGAVAGPVRRFLVWLGRSSIGVLILHMPVLRLLTGPLVQTCGLDRLSWHVALASAAVALAISCPLILAAQRFVPKLSGVLGLKAEKTARADKAYEMA